MILVDLYFCNFILFMIINNYCKIMKKVIIPILLLLIAIASMFIYQQKYGYKNKELDFSTALNKEYSYVKDEIKTPITIEFSQDRVYGFAGVNRYFAGYKVENKNELKLSPIGSTMMAGSEKDMKMEIEYLNLLNDANIIKVYPEKMEIITKNNQVMKFVENKKEESTVEEENLEMVVETPTETVVDVATATTTENNTTTEVVEEVVEEVDDKNVVMGKANNLPKAE